MEQWQTKGKHAEEDPETPAGLVRGFWDVSPPLTLGEWLIQCGFVRKLQSAEWRRHSTIRTHSTESYCISRKHLKLARFNCYYLDAANGARFLLLFPLPE